MTLTPLDIHNKEFNRGFRGYSEAEVDEFLDQVVKEFEALIRENAELKDRLDEIERSLERYKSMEETLNKTLVLAQQTAEDARKRGEKEADLIRERARLEAERIVGQAREKAREALEDYAEIRREAELFRMRMKTLLNAQLEIFEERDRELEEAPESPFAGKERAEFFKARYHGPAESEAAEGPDDTAIEAEAPPENEADVGPEDRQEAAAGEAVQAGLAAALPTEPAIEAGAGTTRPNLWGEPVELSPPPGPQPVRPFPPLEPDDEDGKEEKSW